MASWKSIRDAAQKEGFDFFKEPLVIQAGNEILEIDGVMDVGSMESPIAGADGAYLITASVTVLAADFGAVPEVGEMLRITREDEVEKTYLVTSTDTTNQTYLDIRLKAHGY